MDAQPSDLKAWIGRSETVHDSIGPTPVVALIATREHAHDLVYDICRAAIKEKRPLLDLLAENAEITRHVTREQLAAMCDPAAYLGQAGVMVDRVLARWQ